MTLKRALEVSTELKKLYDADPQVKELIDTAAKVEGMPRHASTHAAGVVITPEPAGLLSAAGYQRRPAGDPVQHDRDRAGPAQNGLSGPAHPDRHPDAETAVQKKDPSFSMAKLDYDDKATYEMLGRGETEGVFPAGIFGDAAGPDGPAAGKPGRTSSPSSACTAPAPWSPSPLIFATAMSRTRSATRPPSWPTSWM